MHLFLTMFQEKNKDGCSYKIYETSIYGKKKEKQEEILKISNYLKIPYIYYTLSYMPSIICLHFMEKKMTTLYVVKM